MPSLCRLRQVRRSPMFCGPRGSTSSEASIFAPSAAMQEHVLAAADVRLNWRERRGPGVPVLFLSGGPGMPDYLQEVAQLLPTRWVVSYDQRGTGGSEVFDDDYSCD